MAGYIGSKTSVTQVDGYNRTEADDEFVNDPNSVISVSGSNVGIGTAPSAWRTVFPDYALDLGNRTALYDQWGGASFLANNFYRANDNALTYKATGSASSISLDGDLISFSNAPSGSAGTAASFTERLRIGSSGHVTMPYQPAFRAYLSSNTSKPSGFSVVPGTFATNYNVGGHYSTSTSRFTAPVSGSYLFTGTIATSGSQGSFDYLSCEFWVNGGREFIGGWQGNSSPSYSKSASSIVLILNANDYVELACETNKTFSMQGSGSSSSNYTYMTGYLLG